MAIYLVNCQVIDCVHTAPLERSTVLIDEGVIVHVAAHGCRAPKPRSEDRVVDLEGGFLMPGLWDAHGHLSLVLSQTDRYKSPPDEATASRTIRAGKNAMDALRAGITAVRVVGEANSVDIAWKGAFASGQWEGPRLFVCGAALASTGGHATQGGLAVQVDGPVGFRRAARLQFQKGADQLKLMATGGVSSSPIERLEHLELSQDEITAAVEVAQARKTIIGAHVGGSRAAKVCIESGVDVIEHGYILDDEVIGVMVRHDVYFVPTLIITQGTVDEYRVAGWAEGLIENSVAIRPLHRESFLRAYHAGVKIAVGEDTGAIAHNTVREMELMVDCGMSPFQVLVAATRTPAAMCGAADRLGTLEAGKLADLIATRLDPLGEISQLRSPFFVMKAGRIVHRVRT
jgi:imidazolonepropionase-like amidohydrolase